PFMDEINSTILKTKIEAIPILTEDNFLSWRTRITALFKLGGSKDQILAGEPALEDSDNTILCAIILAKLPTVTHNNVVTSSNEDNTLALWKAIQNHSSPWNLQTKPKCTINSQASVLTRVREIHYSSKKHHCQNGGCWY
ncbi:hypothetical protein VP01_11065g1, partial [Puccinia sorghi]